MPKTGMIMNQYHFTLPNEWVGRNASDLLSEIDGADLLS